MPTVEEFQNYCNSFEQGYLKRHKAALMMGTMADIPEIVNDGFRRFDYLEGCLTMEGFCLGDIVQITKYVGNNF